MTDTAKLKKRRQDRLYQSKHRGSRSNYKTEVENMQVLLAWLNADLSEGQASKALGIDRISLRMMRDGAIAQGLQLAEALK